MSVNLSHCLFICYDYFGLSQFYLPVFKCNCDDFKCSILHKQKKGHIFKNIWNFLWDSFVGCRCSRYRNSLTVSVFSHLHFVLHVRSAGQFLHFKSYSLWPTFMTVVVQIYSQWSICYQANKVIYCATHHNRLWSYSNGGNALFLSKCSNSCVPI